MQKMPKLSTDTCTFVESRTVQCEMFYIKTLNQKNKTLKEYQQIKINLKRHQKEWSLVHFSLRCWPNENNITKMFSKKFFFLKIIVFDFFCCLTLNILSPKYEEKIIKCSNTENEHEKPFLQSISICMKIKFCYKPFNLLFKSIYFKSMRYINVYFHYGNLKMIL